MFKALFCGLAAVVLSCLFASGAAMAADGEVKPLSTPKVNGGNADSPKPAGLGAKSMSPTLTSVDSAKSIATFSEMKDGKLVETQIGIKVMKTDIKDGVTQISYVTDKGGTVIEKIVDGKSQPVPDMSSMEKPAEKTDAKNSSGESKPRALNENSAAPKSDIAKTSDLRPAESAKQ